MKKDFYVYVAQTKKGHYEVSMPWVPQLSEPLRGPSQAQLKEELMFRLLELAHGHLPPFELDRLLPPVAPYLNSIYVEIERQVDLDRPPVSISTVLHVIAGSWGESEKRLWIPRAPDVTLVVPNLDDLYATVNRWVRDYADENMLDTLEPLQSMYHAQIDTITVDVGYPSLLDDDNEDIEKRFTGRLTRPETLQQVATNLSHRAEDGSLLPAYGREALVDEIVEMFTSKKATNICLVGPSGVGKTAIVHEAAKRAWAMNTAYQQRKDIWQSAGDRIIAGMSIIGQWEQRTEAMCRELTERNDILFVEDLIGMIHAGKSSHGDSNVARFLEPYVEQDQFCIITEATEETWTLARSLAPGFVDNFRRIQVPELGYQETLSVLTELIREIEAHHQVRYTADAVESVLHLSRRFFQNDAFPGKAVRLVKQCQYEALRFVHESDWDFQPELKIDPDTVAKVVRRQTGLPLTILRPGQGRTPETIQRQFESRIFGQPEAIEAVSALVTSIEQGLSDPRKPLGSFLFIGPSGVGKTETAKAISADLFGSTDRMIRFDMSEFSSSPGISRLIGTTQNPDGELTSRVRLQPFCVLLFDEIEKAHPMVIDLLLQVLGDGRLTDAAGRNVDFRNAVIILTSNLGAGTEERWLGFSETTTSDRQLHYIRAAENFFRPEIFNRIDTIIAFRPLDTDALRRIARRTLQSLLERRGLRQAQVMVDVDANLVDFLARRSVDRRYGARTLAHRIERLLITPLAEKLVAEAPTEGVTRVVITPNGDNVDLSFINLEMAPESPAEPEPLLTGPEAIIEALTQIQEQVQSGLKDQRFELVTHEYEETLAQINQGAEGGNWSAELADRLQSREHVINQIETLEKRLQGMHDPKRSGEFLVVSHTEDSKSRYAKLGGVIKELRQAVVWSETQLESLVAKEHGATLVFSGLSGPAGEILVKWHRWMEVIEEIFELDFSRSYHDGDSWVGDTSRPKNLYQIHGFAISSTSPGALTIARCLSGFTWCPRPAAEGHHSLLRASLLDSGFGSASALLAHLRETNGPIGALDERVEFQEKEGHLEDLRLKTRYPIPEDRGQNLRAVFASIVTARLNLFARTEHRSNL